MSPNHKYCLMSEKEKIELANLAHNLYTGAVIVEIGTYLGGSASILAHSNPTARIYTYDLFDGADWDPHFKFDLVKEALGPNTRRTKLNISELVKTYPNIEIRQSKKMQPESFDWDGTKIDLLFDDGAHANPALRLNLNYWLPFVKENGLVAMHDYRPWLDSKDPLRWPDVEKEYERLLTIGYEKVLQVESLIVLRKCCQKTTKDLDETK